MHISKSYDRFYRIFSNNDNAVDFINASYPGCVITKNHNSHCEVARGNIRLELFTLITVGQVSARRGEIARIFGFLT